MHYLDLDLHTYWDFLTLKSTNNKLCALDLILILFYCYCIVKFLATFFCSSNILILQMPLEIRICSEFVLIQNYWPITLEGGSSLATTLSKTLSGSRVERNDPLLALFMQCQALTFQKNYFYFWHSYKSDKKCLFSC